MIAAILGVETGAWYSDVFVLACGIIGGVLTIYYVGVLCLDVYRTEKARIQAELDANIQSKEDA